MKKRKPSSTAGGARVQVAINMASTIDGKIATAKRGFVKLGSDYDSQRMAEIRADHDVIVMGARTFQAYPKPLLVRGEQLLRNRLATGMSAQPATVVVSGRLSLPANTPFEKALHLRRIVFCGQSAPAATRRRLERAGVEVIAWPGRRPGAKFLVKKLQALGFERVLLEGGGELNATFFEADLVDKIYLTLCPTILGGRDAPTLSEGKGLSLQNRRSFRLESHRQVGEELYLEYHRIR